MKTVLAPIDFSHASDRVISSAIALARGVDARLVLLNVIPRTSISGGTVSLTLAAADLVAEAEKDSARRLSRLQRALYDEGVTAHVVQASGDPRQCIIDQAEELHANYVVMAAHGDRTFDPALIGGTTSGVLKHTPCSVVIVPTDEASAVKPLRRVRARKITRTRPATRAELVGV